MARGQNTAEHPARQVGRDRWATRGQLQQRQAGHNMTQRVEGEETPRRVWKGHPSERPEGWLQAKLPR